MLDESSSDFEMEIAYVLFIDVVGYSRLLVNEQGEVLNELNRIIRGTAAFQSAESAGKFVRLPSGDGVALAFFNQPEAPVKCALEIAEGLKDNQRLQVRMGIHSGPVSAVIDVNDRPIVTGTGINLAQRVMDCGDAGHILLSNRIADDLGQYSRWRERLHDLGEVEVKHGVKMGLVNLYTETLGNPAIPERIRGTQPERVSKLPQISTQSSGQGRRVGLIGVALVVLAFLGAGLFALSHRTPTKISATTATPSPTSSLVESTNKSIAVLPFENLSEEKSNAYFADGVQEEILTDLARIADLKVISRTSVMQYKSGVARNLREIGNQLDVTHILEGSVQRANNKVRVNSQLIDARTDAHLWAQTYDRDLADVFAIQSEIAETIADQLHAKLSAEEKSAIEKPLTTDLMAYELYLRAQALYADTSDQLRAADKLPQAVELLNQAVARDPQLLVAWCRLSKVHTLIYWQGHDHSPARLALANTAVQTALRIQPDAGEAHLALADYYYHGFRDYEHAQTELAIARRTMPNNAEVFEYTGYINRRQGHWKEATTNLERALELDPRNFFILQQMALTYEAQRRYADQIRIYSRALTIVPGDPTTRIYRAEAELEWRADIKPFQNTLATLLTENPDVASDVDDPRYALCEQTTSAAARALKNYPHDGLVINGVNYPLAYWEGVVALWQKDQAKTQAAFSAARDEVTKTVAKQPDFAPALSLLGMIEAGLGHKEEALRNGRRACELLPISKDAIDGVALAVNLAQIYAWTGEKDLAIEQISTIERIPNYLSYGFLKLQPTWDSLRGDPRFEKIVASLAP